MIALTEGPVEGKISGERIAKVIARSGLCSRRDAEALIGEKRVSVNGAIIDSAALDVLPSDKVLVDGRPLSLREPPRLWRYYKPKGRVTTHKDPEGRPTVFEALPEDLPRLISIGRLDFNTEGLLLLTNDGDLARHIELPSTGWTRRYRVRAYGKIEQGQLQALAGGLTVGKINYGPIEASLEREQGDNVWISISIREGKNREVRRIMEHLELSVNRLIRVSFGPFMLGDLEPGQIEEVKTSILKDQLGPRLSRQLGVKRDPMREERRLSPARAKPTYLRRKPGPPIRPLRTEEERPLRRRRILPMDGSEAPKVEFVQEKKPRQDRFGRSDGSRAPRERRDDAPRQDRERPVRREAGQWEHPGKDLEPRSRPGDKPYARDRDSGRDRAERPGGSPSFRKRSEGADTRSRPRVESETRGAGEPRRERYNQDRPQASRSHAGTGDGRSGRTFRPERTENRSSPSPRTDSDRSGGSFKGRRPDDRRQTRPASQYSGDRRRTSESSGSGSPRGEKRIGERSFGQRDAENRPYGERSRPAGKPGFRRGERPSSGAGPNRKPFRRWGGDRSEGASQDHKAGDRAFPPSGGRGAHREGRSSSPSKRRESSVAGQGAAPERKEFRGVGDRQSQRPPSGKSFRPREGGEGRREFKGGRPDERNRQARPSGPRPTGKPFRSRGRPGHGPRRPRPETDKET